jgi:Ohr subfamily peroxiredoxin
MSLKYTAEAVARGGRVGEVVSSDGVLKLKLSLPREIGGPGGEGTNPEQLFAAGYAACFQSALEAAARGQRVVFSDSTVTVRVTIAQNERKLFRLSVDIAASLPGVAPEVARALIDQAHQVICPYSAATRGEISVQCRYTE